MKSRAIWLLIFADEVCAIPLPHPATPRIQSMGGRVGERDGTDFISKN
ncbi:hypothetical protein MNBD_ALPHA09-1273, partial [hydrothermal vent metagenome]